MQTEEATTSPAVEMLYQLGSKWAVLTAMVVDMARQGLCVPTDVHHNLRMTRMKIGSGCFSPCDVNCGLAQVEGTLVSIGASRGASYLRGWFELLGRAARGEISPEDVGNIPQLRPVATECGFLEKCACGQV